MRPIDADALIEFIDMGHLRNPLESCFSERDVVDMLESRPTIEQPRWISCAERLPQEYEPPGTLCDIVQVLLKDGDVTVGFCNRFMRMWFYLPKVGIEFVHDSFDQTPVIAWQPLSQPPKEDE